jgi:hypothetical protein
MSRRILQIILAMIALVAIITGPWEIIIGIIDEFYGLSAINMTAGTLILDSNHRYYSGLWFGLGLIMLWIIPSIERQKIVFRLVSLMIFIGGVGRVVSMITLGVPPVPFVIFTVVELVFPLLIFWQNRIAPSNI